MNHNIPPVRNMAAYLAPYPSDPASDFPHPPHPAHYDRHQGLPQDSDYHQYIAQTQAGPESYYPPYMPPKPAEYSSAAQNPTTSSSSPSPAPVPVASSHASTSAAPSTSTPIASFDDLDLEKFEDWDKPIFSLFRFRARAVQFMLVLILICVNFSTEVEYLNHDVPEVVNVARQSQITPDTGRQHFFTFATFLALLVSTFNFLAIALVRCVHPQKPPKSRIVGEIATDTITTLLLTIASTLLLNPTAISNPSLSVSTDLRNVACVLTSEKDFGELSDLNAPYINYPAICTRSWVSIVFGYLSLATFAITIVGGIHRARRLTVIMEASYAKSSGRA